MNRRSILSQQMTQQTQYLSTQANETVQRFNKYFSRRNDEYKQESEELSRKADECVQYILFCSLAEHKAVIKRADLNKNIIKEYSRQYKDIIVMVKRRLSDVFGLLLVDLDGNETGEKYYIKSKYEYDPQLSKMSKKKSESSSDQDPEFMEQFKYSMVMVSLAIIFMNENEIEASLFWDTLKKLDINKDEKKHKYLGDVFKFFTIELVKEGYLEYETVQGVEVPTFKFKAGYRSRLEITKMSILEFVCCVYGGLDVCKPEEWSVQYAEALKEAKENEAELSHLEGGDEASAVEMEEEEEEEASPTLPLRNRDQSNIFSQEAATQRSQRSQRRR